MAATKQHKEEQHCMIPLNRDADEKEMIEWSSENLMKENHQFESELYVNDAQSQHLLHKKPQQNSPKFYKSFTVNRWNIVSSIFR